MRIGIVGAGYVGLVTGACLQDAGHAVTVLEIDPDRLAVLRSGRSPIYEPGLSTVMGTVAPQFVADFAELAECQVVFVAVPTPALADGSCDTTALFGAIDALASHLTEDAVVAIKSTVPPGTTDAVQERLNALAGHTVHAAMNPEFLREGSSVADFQTPDRVVVGTRSEVARQRLSEVFGPFTNASRPLVHTDPVSAELGKYAANAMLAMRVAWVNEVGRLTAAVGADVDSVRQILASDPRIGGHYLAPGPGYGGACFPKDVRALSAIARSHDLDLALVHATHSSNEAHRDWVIGCIERELGDRLALWGRTFKAHTDDVRESLAVRIEEHFCDRGVAVASYDPQAGAAPPVRRATDPLDAVRDADVLVLLTEWPVFGTVSMEAVAERMRGDVVVDARNRLDPERVRRAGLRYVSVGPRGRVRT